METSTESTTDELVQISRSQWENNAATTVGKITKVIKSADRRGWKAVLIRQETFDALKELTRVQDRSKRTLDLAGVADGFVGHVLSDPRITEAGIAEGRARKRAEILAAADEWAEQ